MANKTLTKEEFCKKTKTHTGCWLFKTGKELKFWEDEKGIIYCDDGSDKIMMFKDMPEYGEIWAMVKQKDWDLWPLWGTWTQY